MTPNQIKLVQTSFSQIVPIAATAADLFYGRLFEIATQVRPMFPQDLTQRLGPLAVEVQRAQAEIGD